MRNRGYNPALGRWIQRDPISYSGGINLYEYVGGRAVVAVDPAGLAYLYRVGPAHDLGGCGSTCRFYRNYYYYQPLGEWDLPESPNSAALTEFAHAVFTLSGAGRLVNVLMSGVTISTPEYAYFFGSHGRTPVYLPTGATHTTLASGGSQRSGTRTSGCTTNPCHSGALLATIW